MADAAALQTELDELKAVRLKLLKGELVVQARFGEPTRNVEYSPASLPAIDRRIRELESLLGVSGRRRAIGVSL